MAKSTLYEYAIIHHPRPATRDEHAPPSELLVEPTYVMAKSEDEAAMKAARAIPAEYEEKMDEVEILIRPFG